MKVLTTWVVGLQSLHLIFHQRSITTTIVTKKDILKPEPLPDLEPWTDVASILDVTQRGGCTRAVVVLLLRD